MTRPAGDDVGRDASRDARVDPVYRARRMNPRLIRVITAHFEELQGLRTVATGVTLAFLGFVGSLPAADAIDGLVQEIASLGPMCFIVWLGYAVPKYYACRTGRVVRTPAARLSFLLFALWVGFAATAGLSPSRGLISAIWMMWALYPLRLVWSAWPYRMHHVLTFAAGLYILWLRMTGTMPPTVSDWSRQMYVLAIALVATGLADHVVLMRALPGAFRLKVETTEARPSSARCYSPPVAGYRPFRSRRERTQ